MKILLVAVNAKYIHSNLAVYSLKTYAANYAESINLVELTINHSEEEILKQIYLQKAEVVAFSCYIWNIDIITRIASELKKVQKEVKIWFGGPEVSYDPDDYLRNNPFADGIMIGEGEQTFLELVQYYLEGGTQLLHIKGLAFKKSAKMLKKEEKDGIVESADKMSEPGEEIIITSPRQPLSLDEIPFPYEDMNTFCNRIIYYESSRGCPFSCSYCLSSIEKRVRLRSTELVKKELKHLMDYQVPQVKFVDRTFNCNHQHAMDIWTFIKENDNGITNFHFEISADLLNEEDIDFLATLRPGQVQLEIGVQSTNPDTVKAIHRQMNIDKLSTNVNKIKANQNIHQHLDLIAGLPYEGYTSFEKSFADVYHLRPDQLQLGFLKVLKGSLMKEESERYGIIYRNTPPYEILSTNELSFDEVLKIKGICEMVEVYYNSGQFTYSILYLEHWYESPMKLYRDLNDFYEENGWASIAHSRIRRFEILLEFFKQIVLKNRNLDSEEIALFTEILILDLFLREGMKARPNFAPVYPLQDRLRELYRRYQTDRRMIHIEQFNYDVVASAISGRPMRKIMTLLFDYKNRDPLNNSAQLIEIKG
jgi:Fe-S oxidoreductase